MSYFPSYEMIIGSHASENFMDDNRNVKQEVVGEVMRVFKKQFNINDVPNKKVKSQNNLSKFLNDECEELSYEKFIDD
jgi:hypothetical protein